MVNENNIKVEFKALPENERLARSIAAAFVAELDPTVEELTEIKTAVSEAVSNAVIHGYGGDKEKIITMKCKYGEKGAVIIVIEDSGVGIQDVEKARQPLFTTGETAERSGMGFTVMESFMDKITVRSKEGKGTTVTMYKRINGRAAV